MTEMSKKAKVNNGVSPATHGAPKVSEAKQAAKQSTQRRCLVCRSKGEKSSLLRFAILEGTLLFDLRMRVPSRGYYVCANRTCLKKAWEGKLAYVLKQQANCQLLEQNVDDFIKDHLLKALERRYREFFVAGAKSSKLLTRIEVVEQAAKQDRLVAYVIASDAGRSTRQKYEQNARRKGSNCYGILPKDVIGQLLGCGSRSVLGWLDCKLFRQFESLEQKMLRLTKDDLAFNDRKINK